MQSKKRLRLGETIRRIAEAKRHLKDGDIDKAIEATPCEGCKDKLERMRQLKGSKG